MIGKVEIVCKSRDRIGESPVWDAAAGCLWWTDVEGRRIHRVEPATSGQRSYDTPGRVGSLTCTDDGRLLVAMEHGFAWFDPTSQQSTEIMDVEADKPDNRMNDGRCDRQGRFLAGSMNLARNGRTASLWSIDAGLWPRAVCDDVSTANGLAFSPKGRRMWWADSPAERIFLFDYDPDEGVPYNRRLWLDHGHAPGRPDGAALDADGCYWSARWGGGCLIRFTPAGLIDRRIDLPVSQVTMCAFGEKDLDTLFITSARHGMTAEQLAEQPLAGALFSVRPGVTGLPEPRFRTIV